MIFFNPKPIIIYSNLAFVNLNLGLGRMVATLNSLDRNYFNLFRLKGKTKMINHNFLNISISLHCILIFFFLFLFYLYYIILLYVYYKSHLVNLTDKEKKERKKIINKQRRKKRQKWVLWSYNFLKTNSFSPLVLWELQDICLPR